MALMEKLFSLFMLLLAAAAAACTAPVQV